MPASIGQSSSISSSLSSRINWNNISYENISNFQHHLWSNLTSFPAQFTPVLIPNALITKMALTIVVTNYLKQLIKQHRPVFPKFLHAEFAKFLDGMIKLNLLSRRPSFGTRFGRIVVVHLLGLCRQVRKILEIVTNMRYDIWNDKLSISRVRNWLTPGAMHATLTSGILYDSNVVTANLLAVT